MIQKTISMKVMLKYYLHFLMRESDACIVCDNKSQKFYSNWSMKEYAVQIDHCKKCKIFPMRHMKNFSCLWAHFCPAQ